MLPFIMLVYFFFYSSSFSSPQHIGCVCVCFVAMCIVVVCLMVILVPVSFIFFWNFKFRLGFVMVAVLFFSVVCVCVCVTNKFPYILSDLIRGFILWKIFIRNLLYMKKKQNVKRFELRKPLVCIRQSKYLYIYEFYNRQIYSLSFIIITIIVLRFFFSSSIRLNFLRNFRLLQIIEPYETR